MTSAPSQILFVSSIAAKDWQVRSASGTPTSADESPVLRDPVVSRSAGGNNPDAISCIYDLGESGERLQDLETPTEWSRQIEVVQALEEADKYILIGAGELLEQDVRLGPTAGESVIVNAPIPPFWWGSILKGPTYLRITETPDEFEPYETHDEIVFNPLIDGIVEPNRGGLHPDSNVYCWVDPESIRTSLAISNGQGDVVAAEWDLATAVETLCELCNPDETYVTNPDSLSLGGLFALYGPALTNVRLRRGQYLPQLLDELLTPHGFSWYLKPEFNDSGSRTLAIKIFALNQGREREVYHAAPGEVADFGNCQMTDLALSTSLLDMANQVYAEGGFIEREVTIELYRGWIELDDNLPVSELNRVESEDFAAYQNVWRKWVANEAGDYCELRTTTAAIPATPLDLSSVLGTGTLYRRRVFSDPLTYEDSDNEDTATRRRQPFIQYSVDGGSTWETVPGEWGARILDSELGVYFAADEPPAELIDAGSNAQVRITATVRGDTRINTTASRQTSSPLAGTIELYLDLSDRFFDRAVVTEGDFASVLAGVPDADERDDATDLAAYAVAVRNVEDAAVMRASLSLFGIHLEYEIGDIITRVNGRNISFNRKSVAATSKIYLQVMGITHDWGQQTTQLITQAVSEQVQ